MYKTLKNQPPTFRYILAELLIIALWVLLSIVGWIAAHVFHVDLGDGTIDNTPAIVTISSVILFALYVSALCIGTVYGVFRSIVPGKYKRKTVLVQTLVPVVATALYVVAVVVFS